MADPTVPRWLVAMGVVPVLARVMGIKVRALQKQMEENREHYAVLAEAAARAAAQLRGSPYENTYMANLAGERLTLYAVRFSSGDRYAAQVWIAAANVEAARARLMAVGVDAAEVTLAAHADRPPAGPAARLPGAPNSAAPRVEKRRGPPMPEMPQQYRIVADTSANLFTVRLMPGQRIALQARPTGSIWPLRLRRGFGRLAVPDVVFAGGLQPKLSRGKALGA